MSERLNSMAPRDSLRYDEELHKCKRGHRFWVVKDGPVWSAFVFFIKNADTEDYERVSTGPICPYCFRDFLQHECGSEVADQSVTK